jgi:hypothetical protein
MGKSLSKADRLLRNTLLGSLVVGGVLSIAQRLDFLPPLEKLSHTAAILTSAIISVTLTGFTLWFMRSTDEHDRMAHLWSMTWAYMALAATIFSCWLLEMNGVIEPVHPMHQLFASAIIGSGAWIWMRFR